MSEAVEVLDELEPTLAYLECIDVGNGWLETEEDGRFPVTRIDFTFQNDEGLRTQYRILCTLEDLQNLCEPLILAGDYLITMTEEETDGII